MKTVRRKHPLRLRPFAAAILLAWLGVAPGVSHAQMKWWNPRTWVQSQRRSASPASIDEILKQRNRVSTISLERLRKELQARLRKVEEFEFIRAWANKNGVEVWLFGGSAAAFAHYVHWDLLREDGDLRFSPANFDYNYTNIFRSNQDLDIVVDGTAAQSQELQDLLAKEFPYLQGAKPVWETRLLREKNGDKEALLDNADFLNQHTDSNSVGMVSLSAPADSREGVRDLRDWNNLVDPTFLKDVHESTLHYYHSDSHGLTSRYREGKNPPIFSVIRYLTKAFQYELAIPEESFRKIADEISRFNPKKTKLSPYVEHWLEKNAPKLIQNAVNIEYATSVLEQIGLKEKLVELSDPQLQDGMGWWLSREPLRTYPVGRGGKKTARELGITVVAHETASYEAWESITRAHTGDPNVLISRKGVNGESAAYGDGFYTAIGVEGARGSGITIRFQVDPDAREGTDFTVVSSGNGGWVVFHNKAALKVIPEGYHYDFLDYLSMIGNGFVLDSKNKGAIYKLKRRIRFSLRDFGDSEFDTLTAIISGLRANVEDPGADKRASIVMREAIELLGPSEYERFLPLIQWDRFLLRGNEEYSPEFTRFVLNYYTSSAERIAQYFETVFARSKWPSEGFLATALRQANQRSFSFQVNASVFESFVRVAPERKGMLPVLMDLFVVADDAQKKAMLRSLNPEDLRDFQAELRSKLKAALAAFPGVFFYGRLNDYEEWDVRVSNGSSRRPVGGMLSYIKKEAMQQAEQNKRITLDRLSESECMIRGERHFAMAFEGYPIERDSYDAFTRVVCQKFLQDLQKDSFYKSRGTLAVHYAHERPLSKADHSDYQQFSGEVPARLRDLKSQLERGLGELDLSYHVLRFSVSWLEPHSVSANACSGLLEK